MSAYLTTGFDAFGDLLQPGANTMSSAPVSQVQPASTSTKVLTGDLESSLASLAQNLTINKSPTPKTPQWSAAAKQQPGAAMLAGQQQQQQQQQQSAAGQWNPQPMMGMPMSAGGMQTGQMAYRPMNPMVPMTANQHMPGAGMASAAQFSVSPQPINPMMMASGISLMSGMGSSGAAGTSPFSMGGMAQPTSMMTGSQMPMGSAMRPAANQQLDPFGAL